MTHPIERCIFGYELKEDCMTCDNSHTEELNVWSSKGDKIKILAFTTNMVLDDDVVITLDKQNALALANAINKHFGGKHEQQI